MIEVEEREKNRKSSVFLFVQGALENETLLLLLVLLVLVLVLTALIVLLVVLGIRIIGLVNQSDQAQKDLLHIDALLGTGLQKLAITKLLGHVIALVLAHTALLLQVTQTPGSFCLRGVVGDFAEYGKDIFSGLKLLGHHGACGFASLFPGSWCQRPFAGNVP